MSEEMVVLSDELPKASLRDRALARIAEIVTPGRVAAAGAVVGLVSASSAFATATGAGGGGVGATAAASYITTTILPDVGVIAVALMGLAAAIYGFKWLLSLVV